MQVACLGAVLISMEDSRLSAETLGQETSASPAETAARPQMADCWAGHGPGTPSAYRPFLDKRGRRARKS